jgi:hypothetical protein
MSMAWLLMRTMDDEAEAMGMVQKGDQWTLES